MEGHKYSRNRLSPISSLFSHLSYTTQVFISLFLFPAFHGAAKVNALHLLGRPAHEPPVVAVELRVRRAQEALLVVAQQQRCAQAGETVVHLAALGAEVHMVAQGDDLIALLRGWMGQHGLQGGQVAV